MHLKLILLFAVFGIVASSTIQEKIGSQFEGAGDIIDDTVDSAGDFFESVLENVFGSGGASMQLFSIFKLISIAGSTLFIMKNCYF